MSETNDQANDGAATKAKSFHWRSLTSFLLTWGLLMLSVTGAVLYIAPRGRTAHWTNWTLAGLDKETWIAIHINISILFVVFGVVHLILNWRPLVNYIKQKATAGLNRKWELGASIVLTVFVVAGSIFLWPPFQNVMAVNDDLKDYWDARSARAPVAHAEELTIRDFSLQIGLIPKDVVEALKARGYEEIDGMTKIRDVAAIKGVPPSQILSELEEDFPAIKQSNQGAGQAGDHVPGEGRGQGGGQGMGQGRGMGQGMGQGRGMGQGLGRGMGQGGDPSHGE